MKSIINIKTDEETKKKAQEIARELGVPLSTVINVYLRQFIRVREFTCSLRTMSPKLEKDLFEIEKDITKGRNLSPEFDNSKEALGWLRKARSDEGPVS